MVTPPVVIRGGERHRDTVVLTNTPSVSCPSNTHDVVAHIMAWAWKPAPLCPLGNGPHKETVSAWLQRVALLVSIVSTVLTTGSYLTSPLSSCLHALVCIPKEATGVCTISANLWLVGKAHLYSLQIRICWGAPVWYDKSRCCCR